MDDNNPSWITASPTISPTIVPTTPDDLVTETLNDVLEIEIVNAFTDWRSIVGGIIFAFLLTLPALSILKRQDLWQSPRRSKGVPKSYVHSCALKFLTSCAIGPILVKGFLTINDRRFAEKENDDDFLDSPVYEVEDLKHDIVFFAAAFTEFIEFIFDLSRLVLFYQTPPDSTPIDAYQTLRWNIDLSSGWRCWAAFCSAIPLIIVMFVMWTFVLAANIAELIEMRANAWFYVLIIGLACIGALLLIGMACTCCCWCWCCCKNGNKSTEEDDNDGDNVDEDGEHEEEGISSTKSFNQGEDKGNGYLWSKFKLIAIDAPSWIVAIINPSALLIFWLGESLNDLFPYLLKFTYLEQDDDVEEKMDDNDEEARVG